MAFFSGRTGSIVFDTVKAANMDQWTLSLEGERIDVSDYDQVTFKSIVAMPTATIQMSGPWPYDLVDKGYSLQPGDLLDVKLNFDLLGVYYYTFRTRVESIELSSDVRGAVQCNLSAVVIYDWINGDESHFTEAISV